WKFLSKHGTIIVDDDAWCEFPANPRSEFTAAKLCEHYAKMILELDAYANTTMPQKIKNKIMSGLSGLHSRAVMAHWADYVLRGSIQYFLNDHHVAAFKTACPHLARELGVGHERPSVTLTSPSRWIGALKDEWDHFRQHQPRSFELFCKVVGKYVGQ